MSTARKNPSESRAEVETPISKYLANLERRRTLFVSPSVRAGGGGLLKDGEFPSRPGRPHGSTAGVTARLDFDDTFFHDASMLHISPQTEGPASAKSTVKRKRTSFYGGWDDRGDFEVEEIQKKNSELERLLRQTQAELINTRATQTKLEHLNNEMKRTHAEKIINFEKSENEMKISCKNAIEKAATLEKELEKLDKKRNDASETSEQQRSVQTKRIAILEAKMAGLQRENFELKQNLTQETMKGNESRRKLQAELSETEMGAEKWIVDSQILRDQLAFAEKQLSNCQAELKTFKLDAIKYHEIKQKYDNALNSNQASTTENMILDELVKKYENLYIKEQRLNQTLSQSAKKLQDENTILRSTIKAEMILQEQITSLEMQVSYMSQELKAKSACEAERNVLQEELKSWKSISEKIDASCITPLSLEKAIRQLQNMLFEFKHENSDLKHNFENSTRIVNSLQSESSSLREQLKNVKEEKEKLTGDVKKMSRRLILIVKDRDGLRELKESYEKEFEGLISEPLKERISQLQTIVLEYESLLKDDAFARKPCPDCEQRNALVESLQSQLEETIREKTMLSQTLASQSTAEDETTGVKIVAFSRNPSMMTVEARLKECLAENEILKEKVRRFEEDTLVGVTDQDVLQEKKKLEDQLRVLERKHEILVQAYDYETVQLQQACNKLFGFHVTLVREPQNQIRLQSIYSTQPDHIFIFQEADNNDMMLLETPILDHFRDDIDRFLREDVGSIPGFLASVTITYTQGLGQQTSSLSVEDDPNLTMIRAVEGAQYHSDQQPGSSQQSEIQIQVEGQDSSEEESDGRDSEIEPEFEDDRYHRGMSDVEEVEEEEEDDGEDQDDDGGDQDEDEGDEDSDDSDIVMID